MNNQNNGTLCPACSKDIGMMAIMKSPLPNLLKCPHCGARLRYKPLGWGMLFISVPLYILLMILGSDFIFSTLTISSQTVGYVVVLLAIVLWIPFEYVIARRLRSKHRLLPR